MKDLVITFPDQLKKAIAIAESAVITSHNSDIKNVLICGLGGSGIGGTIISEVAFSSSPIPITVSKGYFIPSFVDQHTLVIISSYSGNTEETFQNLEQAYERKSKIICVTSGGKIEDFAKKHNLNCILVPGGMPPRACLGYSLTQLIQIFVFFNLLPKNIFNELKQSVSFLESKQEFIIKQSKLIAEKLFGKIPVIYTTTNWEGIAVRFRQQLNENSKILCWHHVVPEMNHNELVGWTEKNEKIQVLFFRDPDEYSRNVVRYDINKKVIEAYSPVLEIATAGSNIIEKTLYYIHLGDWISILLAELRNIDPVEVNVITHLKNELSKIN